MTTLDEFMAIDPNSYMARVEGWRPRTAALKANYDDYKRWATSPAGTYWSGKTATAAQDVAADDCKGTDNADDTTEDTVKLVTATITYEVIKPLSNGQNIVNNALHQGVSVNQDFKMAYTPAQGESDESIARNRKIVADAERELQGYVTQWEKGESTLKTQTDAAREAMLSRINPKAAFADGRKILRDAVTPKPGEGPAGTATATSVNYKELYPKTTDPASGQTVAAADPHAPVLGPPSPGDKPPVDPSKLGGLTGNLGVMGITDPKSPLDKPPPPPDARTVPAPKLDPNTPQGKAAIDQFRSMLATRYPPDQVEAKLSEAIKGAQQDRPMVATPEPGTPERVRQSGGGAFAESWDQAGRAKDDLLGINGGDHAKEAWKGVAKGLWDVVNPEPVHQVERGIDQATGAVDEIKSGIDNPKAFIGKHGIEIAAGIATAPVGGEGALLGTEGRAVTHGLEDAAPGHHSAPDEHPTSGNHSSSGGTDSPSHPTGHLPPEGEPGSFGYDDDGNRLRYANGRPDYGPGQIPEVWNSSREDQLGRIGAGRLNLPEPGPGQQWVELHPRGPIEEDWTVENGHRLIDWQPGEPQKGLWDMGHVDGREYRTLREAYLSGQMTFEEYMAEYRNPNNYTVQDWYRNRSHIDEGP